MKLKEIADYLDTTLDIAGFTDASANGVQVENSGEIQKIGFAVDACLEAIEKAAAAGCDLLVVHHGLFWGAEQPVVDIHYKRIRGLVAADMALYAAHLPLDAHPELGHNVLIARAIGLQETAPFAEYHGKNIGFKGKWPAALCRAEAEATLRERIGCCSAFLPFGPETIQSAGIVAGSATDPLLFRELKRQDIDLFITGEPRHGAYYMAREFGLNIFYGSHYQTETFGMKALATHLQDRLRLPTVFIDAPCLFQNLV